MRELGFELVDGDFQQDSFSASFENAEGFSGGVFIDRESKFVELGYTFTFSSNLGDFVQSRLEEMLRICYEFGCHTNLQSSIREVSFSVFTKIYYAGLNYYALKETFRDFREAIDELSELLEFRNQLEEREDGNT
jgi:hypothetical protein